jgi:molecular chaperone GrpE
MTKHNVKHSDSMDDMDRPSPGSSAASAEDGADNIEMSEAGAGLVKQLQAELDEAVEARKRALADFKNYQRRAMESEHRAAVGGAARVIRAILPALDHVDLALAQNPKQMTVEHLAHAVQVVRDEFNKALASTGVERIAPARGEAFDPHRHEAVMRQPADDISPGHIVNTLQTGYLMGDTVLRPAKVSVSPSDD